MNSLPAKHSSSTKRLPKPLTNFAPLEIIHRSMQRMVLAGKLLQSMLYQIKKLLACVQVVDLCVREYQFIQIFFGEESAHTIFQRVRQV